MGLLEFKLACLSYTPSGVGFSSDLGIGNCIYPTRKNSFKIIILIFRTKIFSNSKKIKKLLKNTTQHLSLENTLWIQNGDVYEVEERKSAYYIERKREIKVTSFTKKTDVDTRSYLRMFLKKEPYHALN